MKTHDDDDDDGKVYINVKSSSPGALIGDTVGHQIKYWAFEEMRKP